MEVCQDIARLFFFFNLFSLGTLPAVFPLPPPPLPLLSGYSFLTLVVHQCCVERCLIRRGLGWLTNLQNL